MVKAPQITRRQPPAELRPLVEAVRRFVSAFGWGAMEFSLRLNLTMPQLRALYTIGRRGPLSGRQLAAALDVSPAAIVSLCDRLEDQGYVERVPDTEDRRITWLQLTAGGSRLFDELGNAGPGRLRPALAKLSAPDRENLIRILDRVVDSMTSRPSRG